MLWTPLLGGAQIFLLRVCDVSIGTLRSLFANRGFRVVAASLGLLESAIFVTAAARVFSDLHDKWKMVGYAVGFSVGTFMGITIEKWIGSGTVVVRIFSRLDPRTLSETLRTRGFGVTILLGEGREGDVRMLFVVTPRRRTRELINLVDQHDPQAFVTVDAINHAAGGFLSAASAVSVRK